MASEKWTLREGAPSEVVEKALERRRQQLAAREETIRRQQLAARQEASQREKELAVSKAEVKLIAWLVKEGYMLEVVAGDAVVRMSRMEHRK